MQTCKNRFLMESSKFPRDNRVLYDPLVSFFAFNHNPNQKFQIFHKNGRVLLISRDLFNKTKQKEDDFVEKPLKSICLKA